MAIGIELLDEITSERTPYSCPDCGGALWEIRDGDVLRFRCYTGHMYTSNELLEQKRKELEESFWIALRVLEERRNLLNRMAEEEGSKGWLRSSAGKEKRSREMETHINRLKEMLFNAADDPEPTRPELEGD